MSATILKFPHGKPELTIIDVPYGNVSPDFEFAAFLMIELYNCDTIQEMSNLLLQKCMAKEICPAEADAVMKYFGGNPWL